MSNMTRQHFEAIAGVLCRIPGYNIRQRICNSMADVIAPFNEAFNRQRFLLACGIEPAEEEIEEEAEEPSVPAASATLHYEVGDPNANRPSWSYTPSPSLRAIFNRTHQNRQTPHTVEEISYPLLLQTLNDISMDSNRDALNNLRGWFNNPEIEWGEGSPFSSDDLLNHDERLRYTVQLIADGARPISCPCHECLPCRSQYLRGLVRSHYGWAS